MQPLPKSEIGSHINFAIIFYGLLCFPSRVVSRTDPYGVFGGPHRCHRSSQNRRSARPSCWTSNVGYFEVELTT